MAEPAPAPADRLGDARLAAKHSQGGAYLASARERVMALAEGKRSLVSGEWVKKVMLEHDGPAATLIKAMPNLLSRRIAPHDPDHAEKELDRWVQVVFLRTLNETNQWLSFRMTRTGFSRPRY